MIEMIDMSGFKNGSAPKNTHIDNVDYVKLDDEGNNINKIDLKVNPTTKKTPKAEPQKKPQPQAPSSQRQTVPCTYPT